MADIQTAANPAKFGKPSRKKLSTRVDLTPMVDLGFLLITFFIFTTSLLQPTALKLNLPKDGPPTLTSEDKTLNLVLRGNNTIGYYAGADVSHMQFTSYSPSGLRQQIQIMQHQVAHHFGNPSQLYVIIKPTPDASYKNIIDVLDEMLINDVKSYVLSDADIKEL